LNAKLAYTLRQVTYKYLEPVKQSYCSRSVDYGKQYDQPRICDNVQSGAKSDLIKYLWGALCWLVSAISPLPLI